MRKVRAPRFEKLAELFEEIEKTPKVDVAIVSPKVYRMLQKALHPLAHDPGPAGLLSGIKIYIHWALGNVIVYGSSSNEMIQTILSTCQELRG